MLIKRLLCLQAFSNWAFGLDVLSYESVSAKWEHLLGFSDFVYRLIMHNDLLTFLVSRPPKLPPALPWKVPTAESAAFSKNSGTSC